MWVTVFTNNMFALGAGWGWGGGGFIHTKPQAKTMPLRRGIILKGMMSTKRGSVTSGQSLYFIISTENNERDGRFRSYLQLTKYDFVSKHALFFFKMSKIIRADVRVM